MSVSVLDMSMSLDGYIAGPNDEPGNPGGTGRSRRHGWFGFAPARVSTFTLGPIPDVDQALFNNT